MSAPTSVKICSSRSWDERAASLRRAERRALHMTLSVALLTFPAVAVLGALGSRKLLVGLGIWYAALVALAVGPGRRRLAAWLARDELGAVRLAIHEVIGRRADTGTAAQLLRTRHAVTGQFLLATGSEDPVLLHAEKIEDDDPPSDWWILLSQGQTPTL
ncbi:MAG: hypothetical protein PGN07_05540 [Aeromicrobium erythreum]